MIPKVEHWSKNQNGHFFQIGYNLLWHFWDFRMFSLYYNFVVRIPSVNLPTGIETVPDFYKHSLYVCVFFSILNLLIPVVSKALYPKWYDSLTDKKKLEYPCYLGSMLHHAIVVPAAWLYVYNDALLVYDNNSLDYSLFLRVVAPIMSGFILCDTLFFALPLALRMDFEYAFHHAMGIYLIYLFLYGPGNLTRFYPLLIICETTNVVFNSAWLMRLAGYRDTSLVIFLEMSFVLLFILIRTVNLTIAFFAIYFSEEAKAYGIGKLVFPMISLLQFFWLYKIFKSLASRNSKSTGNKKAK